MPSCLQSPARTPCANTAAAFVAVSQGSASGNRSEKPLSPLNLREKRRELSWVVAHGSGKVGYQLA